MSKISSCLFPNVRKAQNMAAISRGIWSVPFFFEKKTTAYINLQCLLNVPAKMFKNLSVVRRVTLFQGAKSEFLFGEVHNYNT